MSLAAAPFFLHPAHALCFCGTKSILRADYLIDDQPRNLTRFEGQGLLYSAPHNLEVTGFVRREQLARGRGLLRRRRVGIQSCCLIRSKAVKPQLPSGPRDSRDFAKDRGPVNNRRTSLP
ncbi:MAG: hypothetical protein WDM87_18525 [Terracidiphilus sp.]